MIRKFSVMLRFHRPHGAFKGHLEKTSEENIPESVRRVK
jgi:hypothetical protein